jgi:F-type H+-transporting ATPase subunit delta
VLSPRRLWARGRKTTSEPQCNPGDFQAFESLRTSLRKWPTNAPGGYNLADDFKQTDVGARYAQALFDLALETEALPAVEADVAALKAALTDSAELRRFLISPIFAADTKAKVLAEIAQKAELGPVAVKFLGVLGANRRSGALLGAITSFERLAAAHRGVVGAEVTSAVKLSAAQAKAIKASLAKSLGKEPEITALVDPTILGGLKIKVGSRLFDASLRSKLDSLKFALKRA